MYFKKRFVFEPTEQIPQCHAATIEEIGDGTLVSAWYAGQYEKAKDVVIYGAALQSGADAWEPRGIFADTPGYSEGNPILFEDETGTLWHFYVTMMENRWDTCEVKFTRSQDGGLTWSAPVYLRQEWGWMTGCKPITLAEGAILLPLYEESGTCFTLRTTDNGENWQISNQIGTEFGVIQPSVALLSDGRLLMVMRTYEGKEGTLWQSFSEDEGRTWSQAERSPLPNPDARVDIVRCTSGRLALAFNDTPQGRTPLTLALSEDDGKTWSSRRNVETEAGEYSYPALIQSKDGLLHLVYTWQRTHIAHVACDEEWIMGAK